MEHELHETEYRVEEEVELETPDTTEIDESRKAMALLQDYLSEIHGAGAVSKAQAAAIVDCDPTILPVTVLVNSFTVEPSTTNLEVTTEGLVNGIWEKFKSLATAIWTFIQKIWNSIWNFLKDLYRRLQGVGKQSKQIVALHSAVSKNQNNALRSVTLPVSAESRVKQLQKSMTVVSEQYERSYTALHHAILQQDQCIVELRSQVLKLDERIRWLEGFVKQMQNAGKDQTITLSSIALEYQSDFIDGRDVKEREQLLLRFDPLLSPSKIDAPAIGTVVGAIATQGSGIGETVVSNFAILESSSSRITKAMLTTPKFEKIITDEHPHHAKVIDDFRTYCNNIQRLIGIANRVERAQSELIQYANRYIAFDYEIDTIYAKFADDELRKKAQDVHTSLQKALK